MTRHRRLLIGILIAIPFGWVGWVTTRQFQNETSGSPGRLSAHEVPDLGSSKLDFAGFRKFVDTVPAERLPDLFNTLSERSSMERSHLCAIAMQHWAHVDPEAALGFLRSKSDDPDGFRLRWDLQEEWAKHDFDAAWAAATAPDEEITWVGVTLASFAEKHPLEAATALDSFLQGLGATEKTERHYQLDETLRLISKADLSTAFRLADAADGTLSKTDHLWQLAAFCKTLDLEIVFARSVADPSAAPGWIDRVEKFVAPVEAIAFAEDLLSAWKGKDDEQHTRGSNEVRKEISRIYNGVGSDEMLAEAMSNPAAALMAKNQDLKDDLRMRLPMPG